MSAAGREQSCVRGCGLSGVSFCGLHLIYGLELWLLYGLQPHIAQCRGCSCSWGPRGVSSAPLGSASPPSPGIAATGCSSFHLIPDCGSFALLQEAASKTGVEKEAEKATCAQGLETAGAGGKEAKGHV